MPPVDSLRQVAAASQGEADVLGGGWLSNPPTDKELVVAEGRLFRELNTAARQPVSICGGTCQRRDDSGNRAIMWCSAWRILREPGDELGIKITAAMAVLDDVECIEHCINHHAAIGIDSFVIFDLGSRDGTREIVARMDGRENIEVGYADMLTVTRRDLHQSRTPIANLMQEVAFQRFRPDYVLYIDADEFWLPASGRLRLEAYGEQDIIEVARYNVIPDRRLAAGEWGFPKFPLKDRVVYRKRVTLQPTLDHRTAVVRHAIGSKIAHRRTPLTIGFGNHGILNAPSVAVATPSDLVILHFPFSTLDRFKRKMKNAAAFLEENEDRLETSEAWHWRLWAHADRQGLLSVAYESQFSTDEEIDKLLREGVACYARELFAPA